jgi:CRISPR/Cas system-associated protein Cas5 (RAMP superfamily)
MSKGMQANKSFGGLHNLTITKESIKDLEKALNKAQSLGQTKFKFQTVDVTTVYAQYILRYYGEEGRKKRNLKYR